MIGITTFPSLCIVTPWAARKREFGLVFVFMSSHRCKKKGGSLDRLLYAGDDKEPLPVSLRVAMALGIARGVSYLHGVRIIHRDL